METFQKILDLYSQGIQRLIYKFQFLTGISQDWATIIFFLISSYLIIFLVIIPIHRSLKKKKIGLQKSLIAAVDEMIYLLAKAQHFKQLDLKALGGNPNIALMKSIFTKGNCDYIQSSFLILDNMHKVESLLGEKVVPIEREMFFLKKIKTYRIISFFEAFFKGIAVIATLGIYILFS